MGKLYAHTKPTIVSVRISDDQMENITRLMEKTNKTASDIMREAFHMMADRFEADRVQEELSDECSSAPHAPEATC